MKPELAIVKIGGNVIENPEELQRFLTFFSDIKNPKILVHGGGKRATEVGKKLGIEARMVAGRRITDTASLDVALMVYAGLVNKKIVGQLQGLGCNAIGLSGADANLIHAHKRPVNNIDYGWVGNIESVNTSTLTTLITSGLVPTFCALTHDKKGQMLNTNADTIASELAIGLKQEFSVTLYYCFEKQGVLRDKDDDHTVIPQINLETYNKLLADQIISDGMLPKLANSFNALQAGVRQVCIGSTDMIASNPGRHTILSL